MIGENLIISFIFLLPITVLIYFNLRQVSIKLRTLVLMIFPVISIWTMVILGKIYIYDDVFFNSNIHLFTANLLEILVLLFATILTLAYLKLFTPIQETKRILLVTLALLPVLFLSVERSTQFGVPDEKFNLYDSVLIEKSKQMQHWQRGEYRITSAVIGNIFALIDETNATLPDYYDSILFSYYKAIHWVLSFVLLLWLHNVITRHFLKFNSNRKDTLFFIIFTIFILLLPGNLVIFRYANKDAFATITSIIGLFYGFAAIKRSSIPYALLGVFLSTAGAQEKLLVAPIVIGTYITFTYTIAQRYRKFWLLPIYSACAVISTGLSYLVLSFLVGLARNLNFPEVTMVRLFTPSISWQMPKDLVTRPYDQLYLPSSEVAEYMLKTTMIVLLVTSALLIVNYLIVRYNQTKFFQVGMPLLILIISLGMLTTSIYAIFNVKAYQIAIIKPPEGIFNPMGKSEYIGTLFWFRDTTTIEQHILKNISLYNATFVNTIPTVIWFLLITVLVIRIVMKDRYKDIQLLYLDLTLLGVLFIPMFFALRSGWLYNRYFTTFSFLLALYVLVALFMLIRERFINNYILIGLAISLVILIYEVTVYSPTYGYFRPFWSYTDAYYQRFVENGRQYIPHTGWSLEHEKSQKKILQICKKEKNCEQVRIFTDYYGYWLSTKTNDKPWEFFKSVSQGMHLPSNEALENGYQPTDYFILTRVGLTNANYANPKSFQLHIDVEPLFTIRERDFTTGWVYRGDILNMHGFSF